LLGRPFSNTSQDTAQLSAATLARLDDIGRPVEVLMLEAAPTALQGDTQTGMEKQL